MGFVSIPPHGGVNELCFSWSLCFGAPAHPVDGARLACAVTCPCCYECKQGRDGVREPGEGVRAVSQRGSMQRFGCLGLGALMIVSRFGHVFFSQRR